MIHAVQEPVAECLDAVLPIWRGFSKLLRHPGIAKGSSDPDMDHPSSLELDDEEREERWFPRLPWACEKRPLTCASSIGGRAHDASAAVYLVER
jgi:hypothetical protein